MDKNDYRNTTYCKKLTEVEKKKKELEKKIRNNGHPRTNNFYEIVRDEYKREYLDIYNYKCSYCGVLVFVPGYQSFEIDHFKNKASFDTDTAAGAMENLVLACFTCNRSKSSLELSENYINELQPDKNKIKNYFYRDNDYSIKIVDKYKSDKEIEKFHKTLKLNYEFRKIDFLLLNMEGLYENLNEGPLKDKIGNLKGILYNKRSLIHTTRE